LVQRRVDGVGSEHDEKRVAVRRRAYDRFGGGIPRGARFVFDDELLA
jgi:hypothetical protein